MLDFNQALKGLDGTEVKDMDGTSVTLGKLLSSQQTKEMH